MIDERFDNAARRSLRVLFWLSVIATLIAAAGFSALALKRAVPLSDGAVAGAVTAGAIGASIALSLWTSTAMTVPPVRRAERAFAAFRAGECLAAWDVDPGTWAAFLDATTRRARGGANLALGIIFGTMLALSLVVGLAGSEVHATQAKIAAIGMAGTLLLGALVLWPTRVVQRRQAARRRGLKPRVYIGESAVYCAGAFNFWGSQLRALRSVTIEPPGRGGEPAQIAFVVGLPRGARTAARAVNAASVLAARTAMASDMTVRVAVPIPPDRAADADAIVARLRAQI